MSQSCNVTKVTTLRVAHGRYARTQDRRPRASSASAQKAHSNAESESHSSTVFQCRCCPWCCDSLNSVVALRRSRGFRNPEHRAACGYKLQAATVERRTDINFLCPHVRDGSVLQLLEAISALSRPCVPSARQPRQHFSRSYRRVIH